MKKTICQEKIAKINKNSYKNLFDIQKFVIYNKIRMRIFSHLNNLKVEVNKMNVHNIMEDVVKKSVDDLYEQVKKDGCKWLSCDCMNCRLDTVCYVLNRISPKYVVSGRGVTHSASDIKNLQLKADINQLALEGMRTVSATKRPFHLNDNNECNPQPVMMPSFNFSTISGTILDGSTFEPIIGANITLMYEGKVVEMVDKTWINPYITCQSTKGVYNFWVKSMPAEKEGISKNFHFSMLIKAEGYNDFTYHFDVPLVSQAFCLNQLDATFSLKLKDIILFKKEIDNPME